MIDDNAWSSQNMALKDLNVLEKKMTLVLSSDRADFHQVDVDMEISNEEAQQRGLQWI
jgi:hypothetical protein